MSNERQHMVDTTLMALPDTPSHASDAAGGRKSVPSVRKQALFFDSIPTPTARRRMKKLQQKRAVLRDFHPRRIGTWSAAGRARV